MMNQKDSAKAVGWYDCVIRRPDGTVRERFRSKNMIVDVGIDYVVGAAWGLTAQISTWYLGLLDNYTPVAGTTMTELGANEVTAYSEATRQTFTANGGAVSSGAVSNSAAPVEFTANATTTVYGLFATSSSTKGGTTGTALSAALFGSAKALTSGETLTATYNFSLADDGV